MGDETQLSQVLVNLYRNALEVLVDYPTDIITVSVSQMVDWVVIVVEDNGPSLSEEALKTVGEPFSMTKEENLDLGLVISRYIIEQHQGKFIISSSEQGGARFEVRLPVLSLA